MKKGIDEKRLTKVLTELIDCIGCDECPFEEECNGKIDTVDCVNFYLQKLSTDAILTNS